MINPDLGGDLPALRLGGGESDASTSLSIAERITPEKELLRDDPVPCTPELTSHSCDIADLALQRSPSLTLDLLVELPESFHVDTPNSCIVGNSFNDPANSYSPETEIAFHTGEWATSDPSPKTDRDYFPRPQLPTQSDMPLVRNRSLPTMSDISRPNIPPPLDLSRSHMGDVDNNEDSDYSDEWVPPQIDDETGRNAIAMYKDLMYADESVAEGLCVIQALSHVVETCEANTILGIQVEVRSASDALMKQDPENLGIKAGCQLFNSYIQTIWNRARGSPNFEKCKNMILTHCKNFSLRSKQSRQLISKFGLQFIPDNSAILTHSYSRVVFSVLKTAARAERRFKVFVTETRPHDKGYETARKCSQNNIPCSVILDSSAAAMMQKADFVLVGAEAVVESGGIINEVGTYQLALTAKALNIPFYVACESYKFMRIFPLTQDDIPQNKRRKKRPEYSAKDSKNLRKEFRDRDYTPPELITLLFTDMGILTTSDVSDELIKLHC